MAITSMDALVTSLTTNDQDFNIFFASGTTVAAGYTNLNRLISSSSFGQSAIPTVIGSGGHVPTDAPPGYPSLVDAGAGLALYLARMEVAGSVAGTITVYDRVWAASGFSGTVTSAQTVTSPVALPSARAPSNGEGLEMWLESYVAVGATASNVTVSYTNSSSVAGRTSVLEAITASFPVGRVQRLRLQDGDTGVKSIQSLTLSATTGTAGNFGITLLERKCTIPMITAGVANVLDFASLGIPDIANDAALEFVHMGTAASTGVIMGAFNLVAG